MNLSKDVPFNIRLLSVTPDKLRTLKPVTSLDIFEGATQNLHEEGLYSISIFGKPGEDRRDLRFSYIDVKLPIFHPLIYYSLLALKSLYGRIITSKEYAVFDDKLKDFIPSNPIDGQTGYQFFVDHWDKIEFTASQSEERQDQKRLIDKYRNIALTQYIVVIPAGLRDIEISADGRYTKDEINDLYFTLLATTNSLNPIAIKNEPARLNSTRCKLQNTFNQLYETIESMIKGKNKLYQGKWASRKIHYGTRNVITAQKVDNKELGAKGNIGFNSTVIGLFQAMKAAQPIVKYNIKSKLIDPKFISPTTPVNLINTKTLESQPVDVSSRTYDRFTSDEGIDRLINNFRETDIRHRPVTVDGYYLYLIYRGPDDTFRLLNGIDELPQGYDKKYVTPLTWIEFMYYATFDVLDKIPNFVTRYPITGMGSIYPAHTHVKTTVHGKKLTLLDDNWEKTDIVAYEFPIHDQPFVNTISPHSSKLKGLGADYDGD